MGKDKIEPVIIPDVHDPNVPLSEIIPPPPQTDLPAGNEPPRGDGQPQTRKQPLDAERDRDVGGG